MPLSNDPLRYKISAKLKLKSPWKKIYNNIKIISFIILAIIIFYGTPYIILPQNIANIYNKFSLYFYNQSNKINYKIHKKAQNIKDYISLREKYNKLKEENEILVNKLNHYTALVVENENLRKINKFSFTQGKFIKSTKIIMQSFDDYTKLAKLSIGYEEGIKEGHIIINEKGLIGRIVSVNYGSAEVLLISSPTSEIPVIFSQTKAKAILGGDCNGKLLLTIIHGETQPQLGELVLTSGDGDFFPLDIIVGKVTKVGTDLIEVTPATDINDYNSIVSIIEN